MFSHFCLIKECNQTVQQLNNFKMKSLFLCNLTGILRIQGPCCQTLRTSWQIIEQPLSLGRLTFIRSGPIPHFSIHDANRFTSWLCWLTPTGHVNNIPTMQFFTWIARNTLSKSQMLSLTKCVWDFQNNALWDTHPLLYVLLGVQKRLDYRF